eukprot:EG_transcript_2001
MGSSCSVLSAQYCPAAEDPNRLLTVAYLSRMVPGYFDDERDVATMVRFAAANNRSAGLSGFLLVAAPYFLQRLEGSEARLRAFIAGIKRDHRHDNFIVVEQTPIAQRRYSGWGMRAFDLVNSADTKFEAVSFVLQSLAKGLTVAARHIHPPFFDAMLAGRALVLQEEMHDKLAVTISLGGEVVQSTAEGKCLVDADFLCRMAHHLRRRLCSLNPEGRGQVCLYGGRIVQVLLRQSRTGFNLANKVVRACVELAQLAEGRPDCLRVYVHTGPVEVKYMAVADDLRKDRFPYGKTLASGVEVATSLRHTPHLVVLQDRIARVLVEEFALEPLAAGLTAVTLRQWDQPLLPKVLTGPGRHVRTCESALSALVRYSEALDRPQLVTSQEVSPETKPISRSTSCSSIADGDETDLEWMYRLASLSSAYERTAGRKRRRKLGKAGPAAKFEAYALSRKQSNDSLRAQNTNLLNIVYLSRMPEDHPMSSSEITDLGMKAAQANARINVTGFLLYTKPFFLQYLEGSPAQVKDLFAHIRTDPRHTNVTVIASRVIPNGARNFASWNMKTADLDSETSQETSPLQEVLQLLTRQFNELKVWLPRLQNDMLLSSIHVPPGALAQASLVAFAALPGRMADVGPMLDSLVGFLSRGGELLGFLGPHLVGHVFHGNLHVLLDEVADLCADFQVHVGIALGNMVLMNAGRELDDCDIGFYGPLFERAQELADQAAKANVPIVAEKPCEAPVVAVEWREVGGLLHGRLAPYPRGRLCCAMCCSPARRLNTVVWVLPVSPCKQRNRSSAFPL